MKKIISIILCVLLTILFISNIYAEGVNQTAIDDRDAIVQALREIESEKELFNLLDVDFEDISISNPINTYEYTNEGFLYINDFVPLKANGNIVAWAVKVVGAEVNTYQISTAYIDEINSLIDNPESFALIYDLNSCYLYNGESIYHLGDYSIQVEKRSIIPSDIELIDFSCIELNNVEYEYFLDYDSNYPVTYGPVIRSYVCDVKYVSQQHPLYNIIIYVGLLQ